MVQKQGRLGILAGGGSIPRKLYDAASEQGWNPYLLALRNHAQEEQIGPLADAWIRLGESGRGLTLLKEAGVTDLIMAGPVRRPNLAELRPDGRTAKFVAKVGLRFRLGDDALLKAVIAELESEGFTVHKGHAILGELLAPQGILTARKPSQEDWADIRRAIQVLEGISPYDIGQGCVVQNGIVLALEAAEGTNKMIQRAGGLLRDGGGGLFMKMRKSGQDERADMPTLGIETVKAAVGAGLAGIAYEAAGCWLVDQEDAVAVANENDVFLVGIDADDVKSRA